MPDETILDGADLVAAVPAVFHRVLDRDLLPGQGIQGIEQAGLVVLDCGEDVVRMLVFDQIPGRLPLRVRPGPVTVSR